MADNAVGAATIPLRTMIGVSDGTSDQSLLMDSAATLAATSGNKAMSVSGPGSWSVTNTSAAAGTATVSKAAGAAGVRHIATGFTASIAAGAAAQTPLTFVIRDGATGVGTIIWTGVLSAPANDSANVGQALPNLVGSAATAMTIEFTGGGAANTLQSVSLSGFDAS